MVILCLLLVLFTSYKAKGYRCEDYINSTLVFDPSFYLGVYPDVGSDVEDAFSNWCSFGARKGRQGIAPFHSLQYLMNYPDIYSFVGDDYVAAIQHYVTVGSQEDLKGYVKGGAFGRWVVEGPKGTGGSIYISTSERMAGAVDSLTWNNKEFINNLDHGRQMQMAMAQASGQSECWNPTEAGNCVDKRGETSTSILEKVETEGNVLETLVRPAYWQPGQFPWDNLRDHCCKNKTLGADCSYNDEDTHDATMYKRITLGCFNMSSCLVWESSAGMGEGTDRPPQELYSAHFTSPSTYLVEDIHVPYQLNLTSGNLQLLNTTSGPVTSRDYPIIGSSADGKFALGHYTPPLQHPDQHNFNVYRFSIHPGPHQINTVNVNSVVFRREYGSGDKFSQTTYVCVGSLEEVVNCLVTIKDNTKP